MDSNETTDIQIPFPDAGGGQLKVTVGACRMRMSPAEGPAWVSGSYSDPTGSLPVKIEQEGGNARISQEFVGAEWWRLGENIPKFELGLGKTQPYALVLEGGAHESRFDLGGLPLTRLLIKQGAGKVDFDFSAPNPQPMSLLDLDAGAVGLEMKNLANANFSEMTADGGAASYQFDFGGALRRDGHVRITVGMASVEVRVPASTAAKISVETVLGSLQVGDGFAKKEGAFWTPAALEGRTPLLTIDASISLGALSIQTTHE